MENSTEAKLPCFAAGFSASIRVNFKPRRPHTAAAGTRVSISGSIAALRQVRPIFALNPRGQQPLRVGRRLGGLPRPTAASPVLRIGLPPRYLLQHMANKQSVIDQVAVSEPLRLRHQAE
jgi:hypothetical protein